MSHVKLFDVLHNKTVGGFSRHALSTFLQDEGAELLLEFWVVVQNFHNYFEPQNPLSTYSKFRIPVTQDEEKELRNIDKLQEARLIIATYILEDCPLPVNITPEIRNQIINAIPAEGEVSKVPEQVFNAAQESVKKEIDETYFPKFIQIAPDIHKKLLASQRVFHAPHAPVEDIALFDVLHKRTTGGFSREYFYEFLEQKFCEGLLEFWIVIQSFHDTHEPENPLSTFSLFNMEIPDRKEKSEKKKAWRRKLKFDAAKEIIQTYIVVESALEVNISGDQRVEILKKIDCNDSNAQMIPEELFNEVQTEVYNLLLTNYFSDFLKWGKKLFEIRENQKAVVHQHRPPSVMLDGAINLGRDRVESFMTHTGSRINSIRVRSVYDSAESSQTVDRIMNTLERMKKKKKAKT